MNYKRGILPWMYEGDPVEWSIDVEIDDWVNDDNVNILIDDYSKRDSDDYNYGMVPTDLIIEKLKPIIIEIGYDSFEEWREAYQSTNDADHGDSRFPILVGCEDEYIHDGWHRFNYYLHIGLTEIPVIEV